jgi:predicted permease
MSLVSRIANLFRRDHVDREIARELETHLEMRSADNVARGMSPQAARRAARIRFGNASAMKERVAGMDVALTLESLAADLAYALRQLIRNPGFALTAIVVLALGAGASVSIFAFVDAVLIRPLPYKDPAQLVGLFETTPLGPRYHLSYLDYLDWKRMNTVFTALEAYDDEALALKAQDGVQSVATAMVSAGFLQMMGITPAVGRDFRQGEDARGAAPVALISYAAWQNRYGGQADVLRRTVDLDTTTYQIVGVLPRDFHFAPVAEAEFWLPMQPAAKEDRGAHWFSSIARMKDGVDVKTAQAEMTGIEARLAKEYPDADGGRGATVLPWTEVVEGKLRPVLLLLMAGSVLLLMMACVNVASLLLVRSEKRQRELAIRGALGATRGRLVRQFVTEGLVLTMAGCGLGVAAACGIMRLLAQLIPGSVLEGMPYLRELGVNAHLFAFAAVIAVAGAAIFSVTPLLRLAGSGNTLRDSLAAGGRHSAGTVWRHLGSNLVVLELVAAMVLLTGAGLLGKSLYRLLHSDLGMEPGHLAMLHVRVPQTPEFAKAAQLAAFAQQAMEGVQRLPGVESVSVARHVPVANGAGGNTTFQIVGRPDTGTGNGSNNEASARAVSVGYFATIRARLARGRSFAETDDAARPLVVIVNRAFAQKYFAGEDVLGKQIRYDSSLPPVTIVGQIEDMREAALDGETPPTIYSPFAQDPDPSFFVVARTVNDPRGSLKSIEATLRGMAPGIMIYSAETMQQRINDTQAAALHRASAWLVGGFAALALVLGIVGLYGVIAYSVSQRTREIGVRMALGAERSAVARMVLGEAGRLATVGIGAGVVCAVGAATLMRSMLYGVVPWDGETLVAVAAVLAGGAMIASYLPARRASGVNPMDALRTE